MCLLMSSLLTHRKQRGIISIWFLYGPRIRVFPSYYTSIIYYSSNAKFSIFFYSTIFLTTNNNYFIVANAMFVNYQQKKQSWEECILIRHPYASPPIIPFDSMTKNVHHFMYTCRPLGHRRPPSLLLWSDPNDVRTRFTIRYVESSVGFPRQTFGKSHCFRLTHSVPRKPRYARFAATNAHYNTCEQLCRIFLNNIYTLFRGAHPNVVPWHIVFCRPKP